MNLEKNQNRLEIEVEDTPEQQLQKTIGAMERGVTLAKKLKDTERVSDLQRTMRNTLMEEINKLEDKIGSIRKDNPANLEEFAASKELADSLQNKLDTLQTELNAKASPDQNSEYLMAGDRDSRVDIDKKRSVNG